MRETEFLPAWYPQVNRRKRLVILQAWMTLVLAIGLGAWSVLADRNVRAAEGAEQLLSGNLAQTQSQLKELDELLALQKKCRQQYQVLEKLGLHVEASRMIDRLDEIMPHEMALLDLGFQVEERPRAAYPLVTVAAAGSDARALTTDRRLRVRLRGVAPTDVDVARFLAHLGNVPYFDEVSMTYAKDRAQSGHMMREFEVTFSVGLSGNP